MANRFTPLSSGILERISGGEEVHGPFVIQLISSKKIGAESGPDAKPRYRFVVSDGKSYHEFAILATELNNLYEAGKLENMTIVRVNRHVTSTVNRNESKVKRVMILFEVEPLHPGSVVVEKIGDPKTDAEKSSAPQKENLNTNSVNATTSRPVKKENYGNQTLNSSMSDMSEHLTMPIDALSPYQNKWVIKARVTAKSNIRTWSNAKGEGKLFSFDLCDESGEIRATAFQAQCDKFYEMLEVDKVYYISKCTLKAANRQYSKLKHDYEMTVSNDTVIQECTNGGSIPAIRYEFIQIGDIGEKEPGTTIDVIGVCKETTDLTTFTSKAGREMTKREITLIDQSSSSVALTLWNEDARNFNGYDQPVVLVKGAKVGEFQGGKTLSGGTLKINPDITEGHRLRGWFENGDIGEFKSLSTRTQGNYSTNFLSFKEARMNGLGAGDKPDYFSTVGMIHNIKAENACYKACPNGDCNKKVIDNGNDTYRCEKCNMDVDRFKYRLLMNCLISDWSSNQYVTAFSEAGEQLLGKSAQEIGEILDGDDKEAAEKFLSEISFKPKLFKFRTKVETYQDQPRQKTIALNISDVNYKEYNKHLLSDIQKFTGISVQNQN